jgi:hypothetical protein
LLTTSFCTPGPSLPLPCLLPLCPIAVKAFEGNLLFEQLSMPAKQAIIRSMTPQIVRAGDVIITQVGAWLTGWLTG